jgi:hypothetical protein
VVVVVEGMTNSLPTSSSATSKRVRMRKKAEDLDLMGDMFKRAMSVKRYRREEKWSSEEGKSELMVRYKHSCKSSTYSWERS